MYVFLLGLCLALSPVGLARAGSEGNGNIRFHGYGELHYNNPKTGSKVPATDDPAAMDFHRMVWGLSYHFNDRISLHTEVDFEHAAKEMELEFAYLDFLINPAFNIRAGSMLMPVGPLNEFHEPVLFYSVERPQVHTLIIPTTWQEGGVGIVGSTLMGLKYRLYGVSGLDASKFTTDQGIRKGRGKVAGGKEGAPLTGEELAVVGRVEYNGVPGLALGASGYYGGANQSESDTLDDVKVTLVEGDIRVQIAGFDLSGVYAQVNVSDPEKIMEKDCPLVAPKGGGPVAEICTSSFAEIGDKMVGWYTEAAYHVLRLIAPETEHDLVAFVRWEEVDTQADTPSDYDADPVNDRRVITYGLAYFPHPDVAIKIDQERWKDDTDRKEERFNVGLAYMF